MNWEIKTVRVGEEGDLLKDGWEPFRVTAHDDSYYFYNTTAKRREYKPRTTDYIHLRRGVERKAVEECR